MKDFIGATMNYTHSTKSLVFKNKDRLVFFAINFDDYYNIKEVFTLKGVKISYTNSILELQFSVFENNNSKSLLTITLNVDQLNQDKNTEINIIDKNNDDNVENKEIIFN